LVSFTQTTQAAVEGNTYYFTTSSTNTYEENSITIYTSKLNAWFKVDALNITRDILYYDFEGYHWSEGSEIEFSSEFVYFQDNIVEFNLFTWDPDNDSISAPPSVTIYPTDAPHTPGRYVFVNPTWSTHETDWESSVDAVEENPTVQQSAFSAPGDGTFYFSIIVDVETIWEIDDTPENATSTTQFDFSASYDDDGILSSYLFTTTHSFSNENFTCRLISSWSVSRTSGPSLGGGLALDATLLAVGVAIPVSLLIGLLIGKRMWG